MVGCKLPSDCTLDGLGGIWVPETKKNNIKASLRVKTDSVQLLRSIHCYYKVPTKAAKLLCIKIRQKNKKTRTSKTKVRAIFVSFFKPVNLLSSRCGQCHYKFLDVEKHL